MKTRAFSSFVIRHLPFRAPTTVLLSILLLGGGLAPDARAQYPPTDDFNPGANTGSYLYSLAVQADAKILVGGNFTNLCGQPRANLARLNADGSLDLEFNPGSDWTVYALAVQADGRILVGGYFSTLCGQPRANLARLNPDGTLDAGFTPAPDSSVWALAVQADGRILVSGGFTNLCGQEHAFLARLNLDGTLDAGFDPEPDWLVSSVVVQADGRILVGGGFEYLAGQAHNGIGRLNSDGSPDAGFNPAASNVVALAVQADGKILLGGTFTILCDRARNGLGRLNADGTFDTGFNAELAFVGNSPPSVQSVALQADGKILIGGFLRSVGGQWRTNIARLNADGTVDSEFVSGASGVNAFVQALTVQADGKILVAGKFPTLAGQPRRNLGRLNATEPATQSLVSDGSTITWLRGGTSPEVWRTTFERSPNGFTWTLLGSGQRILGGWQLPGLSLPSGGTIRARGYVTAGRFNSSPWFVEMTLAAPWAIHLNLVRDGSEVILNWTGGQGPYQVQQTTNMNDAGSWQNVGASVPTNSMRLPCGSCNVFLRVRGQP